MQADLNLGDVEVDPEVRNRYELAMQRTPPPPVAPPPDHPIVQMATKMLSPLGSVGPTGPQGLAYPYYPTEHLNRTPAEQDALTTANRQRAEQAYATYVAQKQSGAVGPMGPTPFTPANTPDGFTVPGDYQYPKQPIVGPNLTEWAATNPFIQGLKSNLGRVGNAPLSSLQIPFANSLGNLTGATVGDVGGVFAPPTQAQTDNPLFALGPAGDFAGNVGEAAAPLLRTLSNKAIGGAQSLLSGKAPQFLADAAGAGRADLGAGMPDRFVVEQGKTRSLIRDTLTNETQPTIYTSADHATQAQAAADRLNATTGNAAGAGIDVPQEAQLAGALSQVPDDVETAVRRAARETPQMTAEDMVATPNMLGQIQLALAKAKLPATDENALSLAQQLLAQEKARPTVGNRNYAKVMDALGANDVPKPINVPASAEQAAAESGTSTAAQQAQNDILQEAIAKRQGASIGGAMPPDVQLPMGVGKTTASSLGMEALRLATDIPRSLMVIGHFPALRQALPLMADAVARGNPLEVPLAFGRSIRAIVSSDVGNAALTQGFRDTLEGAGLRVGRGGVFIADPQGMIAAREEFGLHSALANVPIIKNLNRAYPAMLNSLRTGAAVDLAKMYEQSGKPIDSARIGHFVNIASGRGDIPAIFDTPAAREVLSGVFFGPRLTTASWQMATDTIGALRGVGSDILSRKALDPVDVAQVRTVAAYVATGIGIMKLANQFGMSIGTDPTKTDFGRITLPDGKRLDFWGPFNENARLVAREIESVQGAIQGKPAFGATTGLDTAVSYLRSKLNAGLPTAAGDVLAGSTMGGESLQQAYGTPGALRSKLLPLPFAAQEATSGSSGGSGMQALEAGLVSAGASIIDNPAPVKYDGLGRPETDPNSGSDEIIKEYETLFPGKTLTPPDSTIGSGKTAIKLPSTQADAYIAAVGDERRAELGNLIYSPAYQAMTQAQKEKAYNDTKTKADNKATREYLANDVIKATDPKMIAAEAVSGFRAQGGSNKNEAYWVALLDRAGKLTPEVAKAIDESNVTMPGQRAPITVDEMRNDAPLVHEYLSHVPYGSDKTPIGTPADWVAVETAKTQQSVLKDQMIRSGINPSLAEVQSKQQTLQGLTNVAQRSLFLNGASLANNQRKLLATKFGTRLTRYLGGNDVPYTQESDSQYQNFPFGG